MCLCASIQENGHIHSPILIFINMCVSVCACVHVCARVRVCFYNDVPSVKFPRANRGRGLWNKRHSLWGYARKITVNPTREHVKIVLIGEAPPWESDQQSSGSQEKNSGVEFTSHQWFSALWNGELKSRGAEKNNAEPTQ